MKFKKWIWKSIIFLCFICFIVPPYLINLQNNRTQSKFHKIKVPIYKSLLFVDSTSVDMVTKYCQTIDDFILANSIDIDLSISREEITEEIVRNNLTHIKTGFYKSFDSIDNYLRKKDRRTDFILYLAVIIALIFQQLAQKYIYKKYEKTITNTR